MAALELSDIAPVLLSQCDLQLAMYASARLGDTEELERLAARGGRWDVRTAVEAAKRGHLAPVVMAVENGVHLGVLFYMYAIEGGNLEILEFCHAIDPRGACQYCSQATEHGRPEMLRWARANGCPP